MLDQQIAALSAELKAAAPPDLLSLRFTRRAACGRLSPFGRFPAGLGKLTTVTLSREVCDYPAERDLLIGSTSFRKKKSLPREQ